MNLTEKNKVIAASIKRRDAISTQKGAEYTLEGDNYPKDTADVLANFKNVARELELEPLVVAAVYMKKHIDAIYTFFRKYQNITDKYDRRDLADAGEGIISRLDDLRNYADLVESIMYDEGLHPDATQEHMPEIIHTTITGLNPVAKNDPPETKLSQLLNCLIIDAGD